MNVSVHSTALLVVLAMAGAATGCGPQGSPHPEALRRGTTASITVLDPHFYLRPEERPMLLDLYEGLVAFDARGHIAPAVAERWSISEDGLRYVFTLRNEARWSDGTAETAQDFVRAYRRLADPASASPHAGKLAAVAGAAGIAAGRLDPDRLGVTAPDERTLQIELHTPAPWFLATLADAALVPLGASSTEGYRRLLDPAARIVSNGPYTLARRVDARQVELVRNAWYWATGRVAIDRVRYVHFDAESAEFTAYRVANIDMADAVPASGVDIVRHQFPSELHARPTKEAVYFAFNLEQGPLAESPEMRAVLSAAIRREKLTAELGTGHAAYSLVPPVFANYEPARLSFADDAAAAHHGQAKALLERSGGGPLRLRIVHDGRGRLARAAVSIAAMWRQAFGVEATVRPRVNARAVEAEASGWDVALLSTRADVDDPYAFLATFAADSAANVAGFDDPVFDALLERSRGESSPDVRFALLQEAERRLLDAHAIAPVLFEASRLLTKPWVDIGDRVSIDPLPTADVKWAVR